MDVILVTIGSHGDVHPFVGLGVTLRERGHSVTLLTNEHFAPLVDSAGLLFHPIGSDELFQECINDPNIWDPQKGFGILMKWSTLWIAPVYTFIQDHYKACETVVVASTLSWGARIAEEKLGVPTVTVHLSPLLFRSLIHPPMLSGTRFLNYLPAWFGAIFWNRVDTLFLDSYIAPALNSYRKKVGLRPVRSIFGNYIHSPHHVIGMFPEWFAKPAPDWPAQTRLVGFPLYDEREMEPLTTKLRDFLSAGQPPIVFTLGSAMVHGQTFFQTAVDACIHLGRRGILLTRYTEQIPDDLPDTVQHFLYVPFSQLLTQCAILVHHGGIGTMSQGLRAGIPQLVIPLNYDQPYNGFRVRELGVGDVMTARSLKSETVANKLHHLLSSSAVRTSCRKYVDLIKDDALIHAARLVEEAGCT